MGYFLSISRKGSFICTSRGALAKFLLSRSDRAYHVLTGVVVFVFVCLLFLFVVVCFVCLFVLLVFC